MNVDVPFGSPQANVVIDQTPGAGDQVAPGSTVTIRIGKPGPPPTTPTTPPTSATSPPPAPDGPGVERAKVAPRKLAQQVVAARR